MTARAVALLSALIALGCAREARRAEVPVFPQYSWPGGAAGVHAPAPAAPVPLAGWTSGQPLGAPALAGSPPQDASLGVPGISPELPAELGPDFAPRPAPPAPVALSSAAIPEGDRCLLLLMELGVEHRILDGKRGILTPVEIKGPIGGIDYTSPTGPMVCDCRLAVALAWAGPELRRLSITRVHFSGAYSYRMSKVGRLSYHAYGLALDVHEVTVGLDTRLSVERDYRRGLADGCGESSPTLNELSCRLKRSGLFKELLTPDYNADHANHLHFGVAPLSPVDTGPSPSLPPGLQQNHKPKAGPRVSAAPAAGKKRTGQSVNPLRKSEARRETKAAKTKATPKKRVRKLRERGAKRSGARESVS
jgi:hypothetical protein